MFDQRGELPLLPSGNPIGFVPASRGGVYIEPRSVKNNRGIPRLEQHMAAISDIMIFGLQLYWR